MTINKFLIDKGIKSNSEKITILQMVQWVDEWQELEQLRIGSVSDRRELLNGFREWTTECANSEDVVKQQVIDDYLQTI